MSAELDLPVWAEWDAHGLSAIVTPRPNRKRDVALIVAGPVFMASVALVTVGALSTLGRQPSIGPMLFFLAVGLLSANMAAVVINRVASRIRIEVRPTTITLVTGWDAVLGRGKTLDLCQLEGVVAKDKTLRLLGKGGEAVEDIETTHPVGELATLARLMNALVVLNATHEPEAMPASLEEVIRMAARADHSVARSITEVRAGADRTTSVCESGDSNP
jgi:hypothetical protein